jgi:hypothetical protein
VLFELHNLKLSRELTVPALIAKMALADWRCQTKKKMILSGVLRSDESRKPDRMHVRPLLAQRQVHPPPFSRQRRRPRPDEQLLHGARIQVSRKYYYSSLSFGLNDAFNHLT